MNSETIRYRSSIKWLQHDWLAASDIGYTVTGYRAIDEHICLGQFLAVANVEEGLHQIARRMTNPRLAGDVRWKPFPGVWGITALPIEFDPASPDR